MGVAPGLALSGLVVGDRALVTYLKRDLAIRDDAEVYYALVDLAGQTLVWTGSGGVGSGGGYSEHCGYSVKWGSYPAFGTKAEVGLDVGVDMTQSGCSLEAGGTAEGSLSVRIPGWGVLEFKGNGGLMSEWGVDPKQCAWGFEGAQLDAGVAGAFIWKDGLVQCLQTLGPPGLAAAAGVRTVIGAVHRFTPFRVENGVNFELGVDHSLTNTTPLQPLALCAR